MLIKILQVLAAILLNVWMVYKLFFYLGKKGMVLTSTVRSPAWLAVAFILGFPFWLCCWSLDMDSVFSPNILSWMILASTAVIWEAMGTAVQRSQSKKIQL